MKTVFALIACVTAFDVQLAPNNKWVQDAEKKHARVAMLALPTLNFLASATDTPVRWLSEQPLSMQLEFFALAGILEAGVSLPRLQGMFELKKAETPGVFGSLGMYSSEGIDFVETTIGRASMALVFFALVFDRLDAWQSIPGVAVRG